MYFWAENEAFSDLKFKPQAKYSTLGLEVTSPLTCWSCDSTPAVTRCVDSGCEQERRCDKRAQRKRQKAAFWVRWLSHSQSETESITSACGRTELQSHADNMRLVRWTTQIYFYKAAALMLSGALPERGTQNQTKPKCRDCNNENQVFWLKVFFISPVAHMTPILNLPGLAW